MDSVFIQLQHNPSGPGVTHSGGTSLNHVKCLMFSASLMPMPSAMGRLTPVTKKKPGTRITAVIPSAIPTLLASRFVISSNPTAVFRRLISVMQLSAGWVTPDRAVPQKIRVNHELFASVALVGTNGR